MIAADRLWDTDLTYRLIDARGGQVKLQVAPEVAPAFVAVHHGTVAWIGAGERGELAAGETGEFLAGQAYELVVHDAVAEYFAHPRDAEVHLR